MQYLLLKMKFNHLHCHFAVRFTKILCIRLRDSQSVNIIML